MLSSPPRRDTPTRTHRLLIALTIVAAIFFQQLPLIPSIVAEAASSTIVISQVYGGGGSTSTSPVPAYKNDYIELFNRGTSSVSLVGWSVQYAATGGSSWAVTPLSGSIAPGQYYLVQEGTATGATGATLPTANASGTISMAAGAGKVALVNSTTALVGAGSGSTLPPAPIGGSIIDYVGYGSGTSSYEGAGPTGSNLSTILAAFRASGGCKDDDSNSADFATGTPSARNASSPLNICNTAVAPSITTQPQSQTITSGQTATLNVTASGTAPLTYQWYQGTAPDTSTPVGTNSTSYTTPALSNTTNYWVRVSNSTGTANSNTATITVNALNPGALQFNSATYSVNENGGSVTITVTRTGGSDGAVSINYATSNGSATSGSDYTATSGTLSYANSETSKTFSVPVIDDTTYEGNETVNLLLSSPTGGATLGSPSSAVLTIIENDPQPNQPIATNCPNPPSTVQGTATSVGVSATDPDGRVISASIISAPVAGITLNSFTPAAASGGTATATLNVSNATAAGTYNVDIQYSNNDSPTPQAATCTVVVNVQPPPTPAGAVVISQIYGGGGNAGAFYRYDFIEIFNRSSQPINLNGWSVQYASAGGGATATWNRRTPLTGVIQPGQYIFIREASGNNTSAADYPVAPDIIGAIAMGATDGKVALVSNNVDLPNGCPIGNPNVIDFVGFGIADCFEGTTAAPQMTNTTADSRTHNGCKDTDLNNLNFTEGPPSPRNSSSTPNVCPAGDLAPDVYSTDPANGGTNTPLASNIKVNFDANVNVTDGGFTLFCSNSGAHTLTFTGGPVSFTLNPDMDFLPGEQCTATVLASHVTAQNAAATQMAADYTWTFGTLIVRDPNEHMVMGNPSGAVADTGTPLNYLMMKPQYALSYNNDRGIPNWTSWHLDSTWTTSVVDRTNDFRPDDTLPPAFKHVQSGYNFGTYGFDRGHMTPSADRTSSDEDNRATFYMTNMVPQASGNNQGPWARMENDLRALLGGTSNELYIVSGGQGVGGTSTTGDWDTIQDTGGNAVTVPHVTWKVVMVLPRADGDDVARVNDGTRTFAVIMPNNDNIRPDDWRKYIATVDQVEALTGYDFFSNVDPSIQGVIEARLDDSLDTTPVANAQSVTTTEDTQKAITLSATDFNVNNVFTYTFGAPSHGVLFGTAPNLTYTPDADYNGPDSFTFKVNDGARNSNTATVSINVTPVNDAPMAVDDAFNTGEDAAAADVNVLGNDTDVEGDTLSVTSVGTASHGTATLAAGVVKYAPASNYNGADSFTYTVSDGHGGTATGTVSVSVAGVNDNPVASDDTATTDEDTAVSVNVVGNDSDLDGDTLSVTAVTQPGHGSATFAGGSVTYTPALNYNGGDSFTYTVGDGHDGSATATVNVTVTAVNDAPTAANDAATVAEDSGANTVNVLTNDSDVDGDTLSVSAVMQGAHGSVANNGNSVSYTPNPNYNGSDSFSYTVSDGHGGTATATVSITVTAVNDNPVAVADSATTDEDTAVSVDVVLNDNDIDGDTLTLESVDGAAHGTVVVDNGKAVFTPAANYNGPASFSYTISDGQGGTGTATVQVTINAVNDNPVATADSATTAEDTAATINVVANDTDVDGDTLTLESVGVAQHGTVIIVNNEAVYTPAGNYHGPDSFTYVVKDSHGATAESSVSITVNSVNDNPVAADDAATTAEDTSADIDVRANDTDVDSGDLLTVTAVTQGAHGTVSITATGVNYSPAPNYYGTDSFTYTVSDGNGGSDTATVSITVTGVNDPPDAVNDSATLAEDSGANAISVLANDSTAPDTGETLTISGKSDGAHGTVAITGGGTGLTYTPAANFFGDDSFTYTVSDSNGGSDTATVNVTVSSVNDNPVAVDDAATTNEDTAVTIPVTANDSDLDGNSVSPSSATDGAHGTTAVAGNDIVYTPAANFNGSDSFTYTISDGQGGAATATVQVTINAVNDNPVATADSATTAEDTAATINVVANDTDVDDSALTLESVGTAQYGAVAIQNNEAVYTPAGNYHGPDSFTYVVKDGHGGTAESSVSITVNPVNDNPVAANDAATTAEDSAVTIDVVANDTDVDGDSVTLASVSGATNGTVQIVNGKAVFTPSPNYNGAGSFNYTAGDGNGGTTSAGVTITITAVNDGPTANSQSVNASEDTPKAITISGSDTETAAGNLIYTITVQPTHGVLTDTAPNLTYVPAANYNGPDSFQFTVTDTGDGSSPALTSAPATVSITVGAGNDAPTANAGPDQTVECSGAVTLTGSGFDLDGDTLSYEWREGATTLGTTATINVTLGYGSHTITLKVTDPSGAYGEDTVVVNVIDTTAPTLTSNGQVISFWPLDKKYRQIGVADLVASASDSCDASVNLSSVVIEKVTSDEGSASGNDIVIAAGCKSVQLRADRDGSGDGRVYTITFRVRDTAGNTTTLKRQVLVPHNQGGSAIDSGVAYTVASICP